MHRLKEKYSKTIVPALQKEFEISNIMQVPKITKVVINTGVGKHMKDTKFIETVKKDISSITGQAPKENKSRKSIAGFKLREGDTVGYSVTLRGRRMYDFLDKLVNVALPRVKDFRGINPKGFDGKGNYNLGIIEHVVFPEVPEEGLDKPFSLEISIVTTAESDETARKLLSLMNFPFKKDNE